MNLSKEIYHYVSDIPDQVWEDLNESSIYFSKSYLKAFEAHNANSIRFNYIIIFREARAVSIATVQIVEFDFSETDLSSNSNKFIQTILHRLHCFIKKDYVKIVICGNVFLSGEHGIFIKSNENKKEVLNQVVRGIHKIINSNKYLKKWVDIILLKDFITESLPITDELKKKRYAAINVDPNMVLTLDADWKTFEDYLASFKSKFRVKAKKAYKTSSSLIEKDCNSEDIVTYKEELTQLYANVIDKAGFNPATLNLNTYASLKKDLGESFVFRAYFLEDKLVGFMSGLINEKTLDAHYVGLDYKLNKSYAIYSRILYDYVQVALSKNLNQINFGRTASEIKSTLGAIPEELTCYVRHKKSVANFIVKPFLSKVKPKPFEQRLPFKK